MAIKALNLICHVDRLGPRYKADWLHFSLNISLSFTHNPADPLAETDNFDFLQPWKWAGGWGGLVVRGKVAGSNTTVAVQANKIVIIDPPAMWKPDITPLAASLGDVFKATKYEDPQNQKGFRRDAFLSDPSQPNALGERTISESIRDWPGTLGHLSTLPGGVSQALRLTIFFRIDEKALVEEATGTAYDEIIAAPVISSGSPFSAARRPKTPTRPLNDPAAELRRISLIPTAGAPPFYAWDYDGSGPDVIAYQKHCPTVFQAADDSFLDLGTLWVKPPAITPAFTMTRDWTEEMELRLADAFDLPLRLIEALRANIGNVGKPEFWVVTEAFHKAWLASLRDLANFGLAKPPDGAPLADLLLRAVKGSPDITNERGLLEQFEANELGQAGGFDRWVVQLRKGLAAREHVKEDKVLPDPPRPGTGGDTKEELNEYLRGLERVHTLMADEEALATVFIAGWDSVFSGKASFWDQAAKQRLRKQLSLLHARKRMLLGNVGIAWRGLGKKLDAPGALADELKRLLRQYFEDRFGPASATGYGTYRPRVPAIDAGAGKIKESLDAFASEFISRRLLPQPPSGTNPDLAPESIVIQAADLKREEAEKSAEDQKDPLRRTTGVGVLLKRNSDGAAWTCLNLANLTTADTPITFREPVAVPVRLQYRNGVRQALVSYSNQPLIAESPAANLSKKNKLQPLNDAAHLGALLRYENPYTGALRIEGAFYGRDYRAALFGFGPACNLPKEVIREVDGEPIPWLFQIPADQLATRYQTVEFRRRVAVGAIRLGPKDKRAPGQEMGELSLPAIPIEVRPLLQSLRARQGDAHEDVFKQAPLVLLVPRDKQDIWDYSKGRTEFEFTVRPPGVSIHVWDRYIGDGSDPFYKNARIGVWALSHELNDVAADGDKRVNDDVTIDDPAVVQFECLIDRLYPPSSDSPLSTVFDWRPRTPFDPAHPSLKCVQVPPENVKVSSLPKGATVAAPAKVGDTIQIGIPAGEVWRLRIRPKVPASAEAKFDKAIWPYVAGQREPQHGEVIMYIEVADDWPLEGDPRPVAVEKLQARLHEALEVAVDQKEHLQAKLRADGFGKEFADLINKTEVLMQRWRWDGRPVYRLVDDGKGNAVKRFGYPLIPPPNNSSNEPYPQDGILFSGRRSSDCTIWPGQVDFATEPPSQGILYEQDIADLPGALYYRFAVQIHSRYEGLMRAGSILESLQDNVNKVERWKRLPISCRWNREVPRPGVKLILPLTQAWSDQTIKNSDAGQAAPGANKSYTPGLLVVLDEPWFQDSLGGLAERLEGEIVRVSRPDQPEDLRYQFGPDPILNMVEEPFSDSVITLPELVGPMGYTFDTDTEAPLFIKTSFVQPPPQIDGADQDLSWHFVKVRYRRVLEHEGLAESSRTTQRVSPWLDPVWVQLLPPTNLFGLGQDQFIDVNELWYYPKEGLLRNGSGEQVAPIATRPGANSKSRFRLYGLQTLVVSDALGHQDQESLYKIMLMDDSEQGSQPIQPVPAEDAERIRLRLVEVQLRKDSNIGTDLLESLFPKLQGDNPQDTPARIVRISPPIANAVQGRIQ